MSSPQTSPTRSPDLKSHVKELLNISHDLAADEHVSDSESQEEGHDFILLKDLPNLLAEFERLKGRALLNEEARPVLDQYVKTSPDLPLEADPLLKMIEALNASRDNADVQSQDEDDSSATNGYDFPRSDTSHGEESSDKVHSDGWEHVYNGMNANKFRRSISGASLPQFTRRPSGASSSRLPRSASGPSFPRNGSDRTSSPPLDETSYHNFSALSPSMSNDYFAPPISSGSTSRRSSAGGRKRDTETDERDETMMELDSASGLKARLEAAQRQLAEKDAIQQDHDMLINRLQDELEEANAQLSTRRREAKENKAREDSQLDSIAVLEADFNKTEKALEMTRDHLAKVKVDYEDQVMETNRLRAKISEVKEELQRLKAEERMNAETAKSWEGDREAYRKTIKDLHEHVDEVETEVRRLQENEREYRVMKEQMERLTLELEEVRRGSSFRGSNFNGSEVDATLSKRLGAELAREMARTAVQGDIAEEVSGTADSDQSADATYVVQRFRRRNRVDGLVEDDPPSYIEGVLERQISDRLHPSIERGQQFEAPVGDRFYQAMLQRTGRRCTVFEESLRVYESEHPRSSEATTIEPVSLATDKNSLEARLIRLWEEWTRLVLVLFATLLPLLSMASTVGKTKPSKTQEHRFTLLITGFTIFAAGLFLGWCLSPSHRSFGSQYYEEDFYFSNSLGIDGRPISRIPS